MTRSISLLTLAGALMLGGCGGDPGASQYGATPKLPDPQSQLLPTMKIAKPAGWGNRQPIVPEGYEISAIATGLAIPRQTLVLPNGDILVSEGRVFPARTIDGDGATFTPYRSGHIGIWICRGTHLVAATESPAASLWVSSAQLFALGRQGKEQLTTEGVEGGGTITRIVTGGAGNYAGWVGEQRQTFLGFNSTGGVNLRVTFILRPPAK